MIKELFSKEKRSLILTVVSIIYLVLMFIIWNVNYDPLLKYNEKIFLVADFLLLFAVLINFDFILVEKKIKTIIIYLLIIIILIINSLFLTSYRHGERAISIIFTIIPLFMIYHISYQHNYKSIIKYGFNSILVLTFIYNLLGTIGAIFKWESFFGVIPNLVTDNYRYSSILTNPNAWAEFAYISIWIGVYLLNKTSKKLNTVLYIISITFSISAIFLSMSRSALLILGILFIGIIAYSSLFNKLIRKSAFIALILFIVSSITIAIVDFNFFTKFFRLTQGLTDRDTIWVYVFRLIKENLWFGIGFGNSSLYLSNTDLFTSSTHNLYLSLFLEMGLIASIILIIYIFKNIYKTLKSIKYTNKYKFDLYWIGLFLLAIFIGQFFENSYFKIGAMNTFIILLFAFSNCIRQEIKEEGIYKKRITHIITGLDNGGAESMLYKVLKNRDNNKFNFKVISLGNEGFYGKRIEELGIEVVTLNLNNKSKIFNGIFKLIINVRNSDVVQTWLYHANFIGLIFAKLLLVDKVIWGVRQADVSYEHNKPSTVKIARLCKYISWLPDYILSCSDEVTISHIELGYKKNKFITIYNGFELDKFKYNSEARYKIRNELGIGEEIVFINVARYDIQKDHDTLFKALSKINKDFKLILCGMGITNENEELINKLKVNNLLGKTFLLGVRSDVPDLLSASDYFLLSSLGEGFPNVLGEAMCAKLIPVVTDVGDCKMIVGSIGYVVSKQNPDLFYNAIKKAISLDENQKDEMKIKLRDRIITNFDIKEITKKYESLY